MEVLTIDELKETLRDPILISTIVTKGEIVVIEDVMELKDIESRLNSIINERISDELHLMTLRCVDKDYVLRAFIYLKRVVNPLIEFKDQVHYGDIKRIKECEGARLIIYSVPKELIEVFSTIKQALEKLRTEFTKPKPEEKKETVAPKQEIGGVEAEIETVEAKVVYRPDIVPHIKDVCSSLNISISDISIEFKDNTIAVKAILGSIPKHIKLRDIAWIITSVIIEHNPEYLMRNIVIGVQRDRESEVYELNNEIIRRIYLFNGIVTRILLAHGFYPRDAKTSINPETNSIELIYTVRGIERVVGKEMLRRLAIECVRELKKYWSGNIIVRLRAGILTEGIARS